MFEAYGETFASIDDAKKYIESQPYYAEAVSKDGMTQTIWKVETGDSICQRQIVVDGIGVNRRVTVSDWYNF